jgi:thioredoxin reductase
MNPPDTNSDTEIVVIGGGSAGLSAALTLARARRRVVVIDSGEPRNAPAQGAHGLLGLAGINPLELLRKGRDEVISYGGAVIHGRVTDARPAQGGFRISTDTGGNFLAQTVLIATGTRDQLPDIPGLRSRWGRDVIHCPYCHGWEIRDQRIGVLATGPMSALQALMFGQWSNDVRFFPQGLNYPEADLVKLAAKGIRIDRRTITGIDTQSNRLVGVHLDHTSTVALDTLVVPTATEARLDGLHGLGLEVAVSPMGTAVVVDAAGHTTVPGVWAAGNVANPATQVSEAAANGARVAMTINTELIFQDADRAVKETGGVR